MARAGYDLDTNNFFTLHHLLTEFHALRVLVGMVIRTAVALQALRGGDSAAEHTGVESGASYRHMVDLSWLNLFPLVYVIR